MLLNHPSYLLLSQLIPIYHQQDFSILFEALTHGESKAQQFQLKSELHRLMTPCKMSIDLRRKVPEPCRQYQFQQRTHWLNDIALNAYYHIQPLYKDHYCQGLYEAIIDSNNQQTSPLKAPKKKPSASYLPLLIFGRTIQRQEQRINIHLPLIVHLNNGQQVHGITRDLSFSGGCFKLPNAFDYPINNVISVFFSQSKTDATYLQKAFSYQIIAVKKDQDQPSFLWVRVKALNVDHVLRQLLHSVNQQYRPSLNHQDILIQTHKQAHQLCFLKHSPTLPLLFQDLKLTHALTTEHNKKVWAYWQDERNQPTLPSCLTPQRLKRMMEKKSSDMTYLYSFHYEHGDQLYFYSCIADEITEQERQFFSHLASQQTSFRISAFQLSPMTESEKNTLAQHKLKASHIGQLRDITPIGDFHQHYRYHGPTNLPQQTLSSFRQPLGQYTPIKVVHYDPIPQRKEPRFAISTPIALYSDTKTKHLGYTSDLSTKGISIQLNQPLKGKKGMPIWIEFLNWKSHHAALARMPYQLVRVDSTYTKWKLVLSEHSPQGEQFLKKLIEKNQNTLTQRPETLADPQLLRDFYPLLFQRLNSVVYFVHKSQNKVDVSLVAASSPIPNFLRFFEHSDGKIALHHLFDTQKEALLYRPFRDSQSHRMFIHSAYLVINHHDQLMKIQWTHQFKTHEEHQDFIHFAESNGKFLALQITAHPIADPLTHIMRKELEHLGRLKLHQASMLEKELTALVGCGELIDITEEEKRKFKKRSSHCYND